jgi:hypothetical protein
LREGWTSTILTLEEDGDETFASLAIPNGILDHYERAIRLATKIINSRKSWLALIVLEEAGAFRFLARTSDKVFECSTQKFVYLQSVRWHSGEQ